VLRKSGKYTTNNIPEMKTDHVDAPESAILTEVDIIEMKSEASNFEHDDEYSVDLNKHRGRGSTHHNDTNMLSDISKEAESDMEEEKELGWRKYSEKTRRLFKFRMDRLHRLEKLPEERKALNSKWKYLR
jgi:hypothetical protein